VNSRGNRGASPCERARSQRRCSHSAGVRPGVFQQALARESASATCSFDGRTCSFCKKRIRAKGKPPFRFQAICVSRTDSNLTPPGALLIVSRLLFERSPQAGLENARAGRFTKSEF